MNADKQKFLEISAAMDGKAAIAARIGDKIVVSEMELIALCTMAEIGMMSVFSEMGGSERANAEEDLERTMDATRRNFSKDGNGNDGLVRLMSAAAAILHSEKFSRYLPR